MNTWSSTEGRALMRRGVVQAAFANDVSQCTMSEYQASPPGTIKPDATFRKGASGARKVAKSRPPSGTYLRDAHKETCGVTAVALPWRNHPGISTNY